jgi:hypothetical protein
LSFEGHPDRHRGYHQVLGREINLSGTSLSPPAQAHLSLH